MSPTFASLISVQVHTYCCDTKKSESKHMYDITFVMCVNTKEIHSHNHGKINDSKININTMEASISTGSDFILIPPLFFIINEQQLEMGKSQLRP